MMFSLHNNTLNWLITVLKPKITKFSIGLFVMMFAIFWVALSSYSHSHEEDLPFVPGEKLTFKLKWGNIPAGKAVLEVLPIEILNGEPVYHFVMTARTNSFADIFFKVRDRIDAYTDLEVTRSVLYKSKQHEGKYKSDIVVNFDWEKQEAQYSNFGKKKAPIPITEGSFDPLSAFFYVRVADLRENSQIIRPVTDGKKHINGTLYVLKKEPLKVPAGKYETYMIQPETEGIGGVFKKSKDAKLYLWLTADERRIPVKIKSKVIIGNFVGELVAIEGIQ